MSNDEHHSGDGGEHGHLNPKLANFEYLMVAGYMATRYSLTYFRYRGDRMEAYTFGD